ncbi:hypothetical protein Tco_0010225 [Tanacetum coccineum]
MDNRRLDVFGTSVISRRHRVLCHLGFVFHHLRKRRSRLICTDKSEITRKQSKSKQARTRESEEYKAEAQSLSQFSSSRANLAISENIQKTSSSSLASENVAFLSQAKASSSKHKRSHSSGSYSSYTTSSSKATPTATPGLADEVIHSFLANNADDMDLIT